MTVPASYLLIGGSKLKKKEKKRKKPCVTEIALFERQLRSFLSVTGASTQDFMFISQEN